MTLTHPKKIAEFWTEWDRIEERLGQALRERDGRRTAIDEIQLRLRGLGLNGDVLPRADGTDLIVGSAGGRPKTRIVAAHWLLGAPSSERFSFATDRPAQPVEHLMTVTLPGKPPLSIAAMRFAARWRESDDRADIAGWVGARVPSKRAEQAATMVLRGALGDLDTDCWIGEVAVTSGPVHGGLPLDAFLTHLAEGARPRAEDRWEQREEPGRDGARRLLRVRRPLHPARHPFLDGCALVRVPLPDHAVGRAADGATQTLAQAPDADAVDRLVGQILDGMPADILPVGVVAEGDSLTAIVYVNRQSAAIDALRSRAQMLGGDATTEWDAAWERATLLTSDPAAAVTPTF